MRGPHGTRGAVGEFGASRNGGRVHKGFDVTARCETPLAAATTGTIVKRAYDPRLDGNYIVIRGLGERRKYWYAHMVHPSPFQKGDLVHVGQIVGHVGKTGNARTVGCHLHFEIHVGGRPVEPGAISSGLGPLQLVSRRPPDADAPSRPRRRPIGLAPM